MSDKNNVLIIVDYSYWQYYTIFGAVSNFQKKYQDEAKFLIKKPDDVDQKNLPNLLNNDNFKKVLKRYVMKRLETIDYLTKANYQQELDFANRIDIVFAMDDYLSNNFRKNLYPEYKAQRVLNKKSYNISAIKNYITNVIFKELEIEKKYDYHLISVEGAEGDDIIACICKNIAKNYMLTVLYASDHDFVQLENVHQYNLFGQKITCKVGNVNLTPKEYLLSKILLGDPSDNIAKVFSNIGPKKVLKFLHDKELLKSKLQESQFSTKQFLLNKKLISFDYIPKELENKIVEVANKKLYENEVLNKKTDFSDFMMI